MMSNVSSSFLLLVFFMVGGGQVLGALSNDTINKDLCPTSRCTVSVNGKWKITYILPRSSTSPYSNLKTSRGTLRGYMGWQVS